MNTAVNKNEGRKRFAQAARIIARVIGLIVLVFLLFIVVSNAADVVKKNGWQGLIDNDSLYILVPTVLAAAAFCLAVWWEFAGGIAVIAAYVILGLSPNILDLANGGEFHLYLGIFAFGAPILVSGILFILAARLYKKV